MKEVIFDDYYYHALVQFTFEQFAKKHFASILSDDLSNYLLISTAKSDR